MKRKIYAYLEQWKRTEGHKPLMIRGARQVGKTYAVRHFASRYASFIEINFITNPQYKSIFSEGYSVDSIIKLITLINPYAKIVEHDTLIFFDEMQEYADCATSLKFFKEDDRFDVICSGSMMELNYKEITSNSVGYKTDVIMHSMDFEEFLWARGYDERMVDGMLRHMSELIPFSEVEMQTFNMLFFDYLVTGGMPEIVADFIGKSNFQNTLAMQRQLVADYEEDITKYAVGIDKAKIRNVYRHIPVFLAKENKKFQITKVAAHARNRDYVGCVDWLRDAGIVNVCYCLRQPELPLRGNFDETKYKLYYHDSGMLIASLDNESSADLRANRNLGVYKGALFENFVAEALVKQDYALYYFTSEKSQIEIDFFVRDAESLVPVEVKAANGTTRSLNNMISSSSYPDIQYGIKLCKQNVGFNGQHYTFPYFCTFLLRRWLQRRKG